MLLCCQSRVCTEKGNFVVIGCVYHEEMFLCCQSRVCTKKYNFVVNGCVYYAEMLPKFVNGRDDLEKATL